MLVSRRIHQKRARSINSPNCHPERSWRSRSERQRSRRTPCTLSPYKTCQGVLTMNSPTGRTWQRSRERGCWFPRESIKPRARSINSPRCHPERSWRSRSERQRSRRTPCMLSPYKTCQGVLTMQSLQAELTHWEDFGSADVVPRRVHQNPARTASPTCLSS
jgi:hypothetical protein